MFPLSSLILKSISRCFVIHPHPHSCVIKSGLSLLISSGPSASAFQNFRLATTPDTFLFCSYWTSPMVLPLRYYISLLSVQGTMMGIYSWAFSSQHLFCDSNYEAEVSATDGIAELCVHFTFIPGVQRTWVIVSVPRLSQAATFIKYSQSKTT